MGNNPMKTEVVLDLKRITAEVAARHGMLVARMILRCCWLR